MAYEVWNRVSANLVGVYDSEARALALVREMVARHGNESVAEWALAYEDEDGETRPIAHGDALLRRAREEAPA